jgi:hypothetical protein
MSEADSQLPQVFLTVRLPAEYRLSPAELAGLVAPLNLEGRAGAELAFLLDQMVGAYWGRKLSDRNRVGHGESLTLLHDIAASASTIVQAYRRIQPDFVAALELTRTGALQPGSRSTHLDTGKLIEELAGVAEAATELQSKLSTRPAHRPPQAALRDIVEQLVFALEEEGAPVTVSRTLNSVRNPRLTGRGGELIMRFFARIDRQVTPAALFRVVKELQRERRRAEERL